MKGFQEATRARGLLTLAADAVPDLSAACHVADRAFRLRRVSASGYAEELLSLCVREGVRLVVPTIDTELPILSGLREEFATNGITLLVSDTTLIDVFADKRLTARYFVDRGLDVAAIYDRTALRYPVFVKPYDGSLSAGAMLVKSSAEMTQAALENPRNIFCEYIDHASHTEFTCDLYFDREGKLSAAVPRQRIEVRGGEVSKGRTVKGDVEELLFQKLSRIAGARGPLTVQLFRNNQNGRMIFNEVNARFGGGYPLARHAGADFQSWLVAEYIDGQALPLRRDWKDGVVMLRYDAEVILGA